MFPPMESASFIFFIAVGCITPVAIIVLFLRARRSRNSYTSDFGERIEGSRHELEQEEEELRRAPLDMREKFLETMTLQGRFATSQGYSQTSFVDLLKHLRDRGVACEIYFQASGVLGFADSILNERGFFELYVDREKLETARPFIEAWLNPKA
jgi:hypothetical protein